MPVLKMELHFHVEVAICLCPYPARNYGSTVQHWGNVNILKALTGKILAPFESYK